MACLVVFFLGCCLVPWFCVSVNDDFGLLLA